MIIINPKEISVFITDTEMTGPTGACQKSCQQQIEKKIEFQWSRWQQKDDITAGIVAIYMVVRIAWPLFLSKTLDLWLSHYEIATNSEGFLRSCG